MIQYPLGATCFTAKQYQKIQAKCLPIFLSCTGINQTMVTAIQHGPLHLGGVNVFNLEMKQGVMKTKLVISHLHQNNEVGKMLNCDHLQLQAGVPWPVLSQPGYQQSKYVDPCYLSHFWNFLDDIDTHLHFDPNLWLKPQCQANTFIMDELSALPGIQQMNQSNTMMLFISWCYYTG